MNIQGLLIGVISFALIGLFHPIVIKAEYHFSKKIWPAFLVFGCLFTTVSLVIPNTVVSTAFGITGFCCFWSIKELFEQERRVQRGWFPDNPARRALKAQESDSPLP